MNALRDATLAAHHREMLEIESGIAPPIVRQRAYFTAHDPEELTELGFTEHQCRRVPALVIPVHGVDGKVRFHRARPDRPRDAANKPGKVVKYEQPRGTSLVLDVPLSAQPYLTDTSKRLWIVEGEKKADALASRGECVVALLGVWAWKRDGKPLPDWDHVHVIGREVLIWFDSDAADKVEVRRAEWALAEYMKARGADG